MLRPNAKLDVAVQKVVNSHNVAPSRRNSQLEDRMHTSLYQVINDPDLVDCMEQTLKECRLQQYSMNIKKKLIKPAPKFKKGDLIRYLMRKSKFSKESSLVGSWSKKIYSIHGINKAHSFKPIQHPVRIRYGHSIKQLASYSRKSTQKSLCDKLRHICHGKNIKTMWKSCVSQMV